jgi:hypothetical protein
MVGFGYGAGGSISGNANLGNPSGMVIGATGAGGLAPARLVGGHFSGGTSTNGGPWIQGGIGIGLGAGISAGFGGTFNYKY